MTDSTDSFTINVPDLGEIDLEEGAKINVHIRGESEGWLLGYFSTSSDHECLCMSSAPDGDYDIRIATNSIDALRY